jgi:hypothetical protein
VQPLALHLRSRERGRTVGAGLQRQIHGACPACPRSLLWIWDCMLSPTNATAVITSAPVPDRWFQVPLLFVRMTGRGREQRALLGWEHMRPHRNGYLAHLLKFVFRGHTHVGIRPPTPQCSTLCFPQPGMAPLKFQMYFCSRNVLCSILGLRYHSRHVGRADVLRCLWGYPAVLRHSERCYQALGFGDARFTFARSRDVCVAPSGCWGVEASLEMAWTKQAAKPCGHGGIFR